MRPFQPALTDLFEAQDFWQAVFDGDFADSDGQGFYGTPTHYDVHAPARPSDIAKSLHLNNGYSWVHWFNK